MQQRQNATSTLKGCSESFEFIQTRESNIHQNHHEAKDKHKHSPNSPVQYTVWAQEHCRSVRRLGSKAPTPMWLWAELPVINTGTLRWENTTGMHLKVPEDVHKKAPNVVLHRTSELRAHCKCSEAEKNYSMKARAGTAGWPQFRVLPCPLQKLQSMREDLPQRSTAVPAVQFGFCFHISPLRRGATTRWLRCPPNIHSQQKCHPKQIRESREQ